MVTRLTIAMAFLLLAAPLPAEAQQAGKVYRIGFLSTTSAAGSQDRVACFRDGLRRVGLIDGQNIVIEYRWADGSTARLPGLAAELAGLKLDLIVTQGTQTAQAMKRTTREIPVVFTMVSDPVASGIVTNLARPQENMTGLSNLLPAMSGKLLELLKTAVPNAVRVVVLRDPANEGKALEFQELRTSGQQLGMAIQSLDLRTSEDIDSAFAAMVPVRPDALITLVDAVTLRHQQKIVEHAARIRLPAIYQTREFVEAGGLMSYGLSLCQHFRRSGLYVDRILKGAKPADLPVEQPTTFELVINLKTAKALGLTIPPVLLLRADQVIE